MSTFFGHLALHPLSACTLSAHEVTGSLYCYLHSSPAGTANANISYKSYFQYLHCLHLKPKFNERTLKAIKTYLKKCMHLNVMHINACKCTSTQHKSIEKKKNVLLFRSLQGPIWQLSYEGSSEYAVESWLVRCLNGRFYRKR